MDWSRTYAYAVGLGGVYLNLRGREGQGILEEGTEAERVRTAIQSGLAGVVDDQTGCRAIQSVLRREDLYRGPYAANGPDLLVNFCPGFRVSWQSAAGGFAASVLADNTRRWSGDHIIDPEQVPGILFMNRSCKRDRASILDLAPTILNHLGVSVPEAMEGISLI
jgi:predicted AlkP superfamily phosphohydrolase/phosphomutase